MSKLQNSVDFLRNLSIDTNSIFSQNFASAGMRWNSDLGSGISRAFEVAPGISVLIHDILLREDFNLPQPTNDENFVYFIYCFEGHIKHKFGKDDSFDIINKHQNVILQSSKVAKNVLSIPKDVNIKFSTIYIAEDKFTNHSSLRAKYIYEGLSDVFEAMGDERPYRYYGAIKSKIVQYARLFYINTKIDFISRLIMEGATFNILANQIQSHISNNDSILDKTSLADYDLQSILELSDYIAENLDKKLTMEVFKSIAGMSAMKIQSGFRYLFNDTVNQFVRNARMNKAQELIELSNLNMSEISYSIGINSRSYFSKEFSSFFGVSPKDYRKSLEDVKPHFEISYHSIAKPKIDGKEIQNILDEAVAFNSEHNITGCLLYHDGTFFQILEGKRQTIMNLLDKISKDSRHSNVEVLWKGYKANRNFNDWSMGFIDKPLIDHIDKVKDIESFNFLSVLEKEKINVQNKKMFWQKVKKMLIAYSTEVVN